VRQVSRPNSWLSGRRPKMRVRSIPVHGGAEPNHTEERERGLQKAAVSPCCSVDRQAGANPGIRHTPSSSHERRIATALFISQSILTQQRD
jgi:hypothetical protein